MFLTQKEVFLISDPPHLLKAICNCFAREKLWVCSCINFALYRFIVCLAQEISWDMIVQLYQQNAGRMTTITFAAGI